MSRNRDGSPSILSEEYAANPYALHQEMRNEFPVFYEDNMNAFVLSRYRDVSAAFKNAEVFTNRNYDWQLEPGHGGRTIVQMEGQEHSTKRSLAAPSFRGKDLAEKYMTVVEDASRRLLEPMLSKDTADYAAEYAQLFPINVVARLLDLPNSELERFRKWYTALIEFLGNIGGDPHIAEEGYRARDEMLEYMLPVIAERRENPGDDVLSILCQAEIDGVQMTDREIKAFCSLILTAGGETSDKALTSMLGKLLQLPDQFAEMRRDRSLILPAMSETLRLAPPMQMALRETDSEVQVEGATIPAGTTVVLLLSAANRDPEHFGDPESFDIHRFEDQADRQFTAGTDQLAFVQGRHFCLGAQLVKAETQVGINQLLDMTSSISLAPGFVPMEKGSFMRAPRRLDIHFETSAVPA